MTDQRRTDTAAEDRQESRREARRIPPLVWVVIFLLVAWFAWAWMQRAGHDVTPHGGTVPRVAESPSIMPATPANGGAPAQPAETVNGPHQAGARK